MAESRDAVRAPVMVSLKLLDAHPKNPRLRHDQDFISSLAAGMKDGFDPIYAPTVRRKADDRFEIIIGHRRKLAADKAGLDEIPVHIVDWSDERVLRELAFSNIQDRLSPLEIAVYSFEVEPAKGKKGAGLKEYASRWNLADSTLGRYRNGASVFQAIRSVTSENVLGGLHDKVEHLAKIAKAPREKWGPLVERLVNECWSIKNTESVVEQEIGVPASEPSTNPVQSQAESLAPIVPLFPPVANPVADQADQADDLEDEDDDDWDDDEDNDGTEDPHAVFEQLEEAAGTPEDSQTTTVRLRDQVVPTPPALSPEDVEAQEADAQLQVAVRLQNVMAEANSEFRIEPDDWAQVDAVRPFATDETFLLVLRAIRRRVETAETYRIADSKVSPEGRRLRREKMEAEKALATLYKSFEEENDDESEEGEDG